MNSVRVVDVFKKYDNGMLKVNALRDINLTIQSSEFVSIVGTSGSGKSTLLNLIGGLDYPSSGDVFVDDVNFKDMNEEELTIFRRRNIGFIFQDFNLLPLLNVYENIVLPIQLDGKKIDYEFVDQITRQIGIQDKLEFYPNQLSGGQQQRVAIARAIATKPAIILADEPTGNLDSKTSQDVLGLLKMTGKKYKQTIMMITHDETIAQMADRVLRIEDGSLRE
ncbi:ABC transporter ATP-binding protein [uncultured Vagococcus sp.]|uniref:ABC transporter ATP-binding protein n=1 Tax=uncultured Vagococcus sp. TaxID=189676 RepID=UPI0028D2522B|nr:ABC transporter ATP-binding protein [uncultured Vagococcus sp.]